MYNTAIAKTNTTERALIGRSQSGYYIKSEII